MLEFTNISFLPVNGYSVPKDKKRSLRSVNYSVEIWDVTKKQRIRNFTVSNSRYAFFSWSPDDSTIVTDLDGIVSLWDARTGTQSNSLPQLNHDGSSDLPRFSWSPDATWIALCDNGQAKLWDVSLSNLVPLTGSSDLARITPKSFSSAHGLLATTLSAEFAAATLWDLRQLKPLVQFDDDRWGLFPSPDGTRLAAVSRCRPSVTRRTVGGTAPAVDKEIRFFSLPDGKEQGLVKLLLADYVVADWAPDSSRVAVYSNPSDPDLLTKLTVLDGPKLVSEFDEFSSKGKVAWSRDSKYLAWVDRHRAVKVTDIAIGEIACTLGRTTPIRRSDTRTGGLTWSPDGRMIAYQYGEPRTSSSRILIWDVVESSELVEPRLRLDAATSGGVFYSPDGKLIASIELTQGFGVWDVHSGKKVVRISFSNRQYVDNLFWLPDNRRVVFSGPSGFGIADITTGKLKHPENNVDQFSAIALSDRTVAASYGRRVAFYNETMNLTTTIVLPTAPKTGLLSVQANGAYRLGPGVAEPRIVALIDGAQQTFTPAEFSSRFAWKNKPVQP